MFDKSKTDLYGRLLTLHDNDNLFQALRVHASHRVLVLFCVSQLEICVSFFFDVEVVDMCGWCSKLSHTFADHHNLFFQGCGQADSAVCCPQRSAVPDHCDAARTAQLSL